MMIKETILINAPMEKVWDTFTDLTCWTNWNTVLQNVNSAAECLTGGNDIKCCFRPFWFPINVRIRIEEIRKYDRVVWTAQKKGLFAFHEFFFQTEELAILVTSKETFTGLLASASGFLLPVGIMRSLTKTFLSDLKKASEKV